MRKRYFILLVARDAEGQLLKIPIPIHYLYVFIAGAVLGMMTITGMAGSYTRMLVKVARFNELRTEKDALKTQYSHLERVAQENEVQAASLGSLAGEVSALYGLKSASTTTSAGTMTPDNFASSLDQFDALKKTALSGAASIAIGMGANHDATLTDWVRLAAAPSVWPVQGPVRSSFGGRLDPFNGEGAFHSGIDISSSYGHPVIAPADGMVESTDFEGGYGRAMRIDHGHGVTTLYGHLSGFAVSPGQHVRRGETIAYIGLTGRSTGPHLHYEVRINNTPVNPYKYMRDGGSDNFARGVAN